MGEGEGGEEVGFGEGTEWAQSGKNGQSELRGGCRSRHCALGDTASERSSEQHGELSSGNGVRSILQSHFINKKIAVLPFLQF